MVGGGGKVPLSGKSIILAKGKWNDTWHKHCLGGDIHFKMFMGSYVMMMSSRYHQIPLSDKYPQFKTILVCCFIYTMYLIT